MYPVAIAPGTDSVISVILFRGLLTQIMKIETAVEIGKRMLKFAKCHRSRNTMRALNFSAKCLVCRIWKSLRAVT